MAPLAAHGKILDSHQDAHQARRSRPKINDTLRRCGFKLVFSWRRFPFTGPSDTDLLWCGLYGGPRVSYMNCLTHIDRNRCPGSVSSVNRFIYRYRNYRLLVAASRRHHSYGRTGTATTAAAPACAAAARAPSAASSSTRRSPTRAP